MNRICSLNLTFKILEFAIFWKYSTGFWFESSDKTPNNRLKFLISSCSNLYVKESIWKEMCLIKHILLRHFQNLQQSIQNYFRQTKLNFLYSFPKTIESYFRFLFFFFAETDSFPNDNYITYITGYRNCAFAKCSIFKNIHLLL